MGCVEDYVQNGSINPANVLRNVALGSVKGAGMNRFQFTRNSGIFSNNKFLRKAANTVIGTGYGMTVDGLDCALRGEDYDWKQSMTEVL